MIFSETPISGAFIIEAERYEDERGFFARTWDRDEFAARGLATNLAQCSVSFNHKKGTLRGMHHQAAPFAETKLVRCSNGAVHDVIVDLRLESASFTRWFAVELSARNYRMLYIPAGVAHGFQTLSDNSELFYQMTELYHPEAAVGVRWNDPAFAITWPLEVAVIAERDRTYPDFRRADYAQTEQQ